MLMCRYTFQCHNAPVPWRADTSKYEGQEYADASSCAGGIVAHLSGIDELSRILPMGAPATSQPTGHVVGGCVSAQLSRLSELS